jgi:hypothetical protein
MKRNTAYLIAVAIAAVLIAVGLIIGKNTAAQHYAYDTTCPAGDAECQEAKHDPYAKMSTPPPVVEHAPQPSGATSNQP